MNIAHITAYYPPHLGGIERCAKSIAEQLAKDGHTVTVLTSNVGAGKRRTVRHGNLSEVYLWGLEVAHTPIIPTLPMALFRLDQNTVIHVHLSHIFTELTVFLVAAVRRMPYIAHYHMDVEPSGRLGFLFNLYKRTLLPFVIRGAATVITLSDEQRNLVIKRYKARPANVIVIPNGIDDRFFDTAGPRIAKQVTDLLFVGRFALQKNIPRLLRALPLIQHRAHLHLVGDGEKRSDIERIIRELGLRNVTIHGRLDGDVLAEMYRKVDIFVLPSDKEGMPLAMLEAMATGLPIIGSDVLGIREFIEDVGIVVKDPSPQTFARSLDDAIGNPQRLRQFGIAGRRMAQGYAWPALIKQLEQVYRATRP